MHTFLKKLDTAHHSSFTPMHINKPENPEQGNCHISFDTEK